VTSLKTRLSFTFDKETLKLIDTLINSKDYRNRSHAVEHAIKVLGNKIIKKGVKNEGKS
jgi:metal-responsive CopG/Arc/MetJ family transcriptional regulator